MLSVAANPACPDTETAERAVNEVWDSCFPDTRPFDEVSWLRGSGGRAGSFESPLFLPDLLELDNSIEICLQPPEYTVFSGQRITGPETPRLFL